MDAHIYRYRDQVSFGPWNLEDRSRFRWVIKQCIWNYPTTDVTWDRWPASIFRSQNVRIWVSDFTKCKNLGVRFRKPKSGNVRFQKVKNLNVNLTDLSASPTLSKCMWPDTLSKRSGIRGKTTGHSRWYEPYWRIVLTWRNATDVHMAYITLNSIIFPEMRIFWFRGVYFQATEELTALNGLYNGV